MSWNPRETVSNTAGFFRAAARACSALARQNGPSTNLVNSCKRSSTLGALPSRTKSCNSQDSSPRAPLHRASSTPCRNRLVASGMSPSAIAVHALA